MNPSGESEPSNRLFVAPIPVWYQSNGKVSPRWLSACQKERNQTRSLMEQIICPINLQEALRQVQHRIYDKSFSDYSYGFPQAAMPTKP
jgi:hypothetical protein